MLHKVKVSAGLRIAVTTVLLLLTGVFGNELFAEWRVSSEMAHVRRAAIDATKISRLINELQAERGLSAAYLGAHGATPRRQVDEQRSLTDTRLPSAVTALRDLQRFPIGSGGKSLVTQALAEIDELGNVRERINARSISSAQEFFYYTELIAKLLDVTNDFALTTSRTDVGTILTAYTLLQRAKERAAQERGRTAGVLAEGKFSPEAYQEIVGMVSGQQALFDTLRLTAPASVIREYEALKETPVWRDVMRLREQLLSAGLTGATAKISVAEWWAAATARIQLIGDMEDNAGRELIEIASSIHGRSTDRLVQTTLLALSCLGLSGWALRFAVTGSPISAGAARRSVDANILSSLPQSEHRPQLEDIHAYRSLGERADDLEQTIAQRQAELADSSEKMSPERRAELQHDLGAAYLKRIRGDRADNIERAITWLDAALAVRNRGASIDLWAETLITLGQAFLNRIQGVRSQNIERAISLLDSACAELRPETFPDPWAEAKQVLGQAYQERIFGDRADNLERAIAALEAVLTVRKPECSPRQWAEVQNSLATAYSNRIRGERADNLERAVIAYGAAHSLPPPHGAGAYGGQAAKR